MFENFARVWTPVLLASDLTSSKPQGVRVAGTPIVLFRDAKGVAHAMLDRCPHRGVALHLGSVKDGCLTCPFHGWEFDSAGALRGVPWNPDAKLGRVSVPVFPVREVAGLVWMYTAPSASLSRAGELPPPLVPDALVRGDVRIAGLDVSFATHWTRVMENMLDWPHLPFVHRGSIGKRLARVERGRMDIRVDERPWGFHSTITVDGHGEGGALDYYFPNVMVLTIPIPVVTLKLMTVCVPVDEGTTRLIVLSARDFLRSRIFDNFFNRSNLPIVEEDRAVVESSWPMEVPPAREEASVRTDAPTLYFRKRYHAELRTRAVTDDGRVSLAGLETNTSS